MQAGGSPRRIAALLLGASVFLYLVPVLWGRTLTGHESVQPQTSREMLHQGNWLIPTIGGDPWLERPPPPMWWIATVYRVAGIDASDRVARLAALLAALPTLLLTAAIAYRFYGPGMALMAGLILATMHEFFAYAINPEADIFLCLVVTAVLTLFVYEEFGSGGHRRSDSTMPSVSLWGRRPWRMAVFFLLLGGTNWAKGLIFGTVMAVAPIAAFLLSEAVQRRSWQPLRPYLWVWGGLLASVAALAWPAMVIGRYPEIVQLWQEHYLGRLHRGYLREPWWYYAVQTPYVLLPWTLAAVIGLAVTGRLAWRQAGRERFLWCWALAAPLALSLADGKHHHYLLHCLGGWAILAAAGMQPLWRWCQPKLACRRLVPLGGAVGAGLVAFALATPWHSRIPGGWPVVLAGATIAGIGAGMLLWAGRQREPRRAFLGAFAPLAAAYALWVPYQAAYLDDYRHDLVFLHQAEQIIPHDTPVLVQYDWTAPLETFWVLYHLHRPGVLIRDPWQAAEKTARSGEQSAAYVLARRLDLPVYSQAADVEVLLESVCTRGEKEPSQRRVLCRLRFSSPLPPPPEDYIRMVRRTLW